MGIHLHTSHSRSRPERRWELSVSCDRTRSLQDRDDASHRHKRERQAETPSCLCRPGQPLAHRAVQGHAAIEAEPRHKQWRQVTAQVPPPALQQRAYSSAQQLHHLQGPDPGQHEGFGTEPHFLHRGFAAVHRSISGRAEGDSRGSAEACDPDDNDPAALMSCQFDGDIVVVDTTIAIEYGCQVYLSMASAVFCKQPVADMWIF